MAIIKYITCAFNFIRQRGSFPLHVWCSFTFSSVCMVAEAVVVVMWHEVAPQVLFISDYICLLFPMELNQSRCYACVDDVVFYYSTK